MSCSAQDGGSGFAQIAANHVPSLIGGRTIRRRAYTTKRGVHVRSSRVRDMGALGKWSAKHGPGIGALKEGKLVRLGYAASKGKTARHRALKKAVKRYGALSTFRKLNAASTYTKRTSKGRSRTFKADRNWVKKSYM
jgi:hypothetical protein